MIPAIVHDGMPPEVGLPLAAIGILIWLGIVVVEAVKK